MKNRVYGLIGVLVTAFVFVVGDVALLRADEGNGWAMVVYLLARVAPLVFFILRTDKD